MPRSKHKNGKLNRELNRELKRSKKTRASNLKLKLRNKCGGASGRSPDGRKLSRFGLNRLTVRKKKKKVKLSRTPSYLGAIEGSTRPPSSPRRSSRSSRSSRAGPAKAASPRSRSQSPPPSRRRPPSSPRRSSSSKSSSASSNNARRRKLFNKVMSDIRLEYQRKRRRKLFNNITAQSGTILGGILEHLNEKEIARFKQADTTRYNAVTEEMNHKNYTFLIDIYDEFKEVIEKIEHIDVNKNNYLQTTPNKLKEIQEVYITKEEVSKDSELIDNLIAIFFKHIYKTITGKNPLDKYMKYLKQTSKNQFGEYSEDIERGLAILTLFYGFSDYDIKYIIFSKIKNPEIFSDYISLLNQLCLNQGNITFNPNIGYEFKVRAAQTSKKFNKAGIDKYVELRKEKKDHDQATDELKENPEFLR